MTARNKQEKQGEETKEGEREKEETDLNEEIGRLWRAKDKRIEIEERRKRIKEIITKMAAEEGVVKTHAMVTKWVKEYLETGESSEKTVKELNKKEEKSPWNWGQTNKYLTALQKKKIISFARNENGEKTCQIDFTSEKEEGREKTKEEPEQKRLLRYYIRKREWNREELRELMKDYQEYLQKVTEKEKAREKWEQRKKEAKRKWRKTTKKERKAFYEELTDAYLGIEEGKEGELEATERLLKTMQKKPAMIRGLKKKE